MKHFLTLAVVLAATVLTASVVMADVPHLINYQGYLTMPNGHPVQADSVAITFTIYDDSTGGTDLWSSGIQRVDLDVGRFNYLLGSNEPFPADLFSADTTRWIGIQDSTGAESVPRMRFATLPYSFEAAHADVAALATTVANNAVTNTQILNSTILFEDIGQNGADSGQVMKWDGSSWTVSHDSVGAGNGWIDDGTVVRLETSTDSVGIGTATPTEKLEVEGNLSVSGTATIGSGHTNTGVYSFVAGAQSTASGDYSTVSGGFANTAGDLYGTISGGANNSAGNHGVVGGGRYNGATAMTSTVGGGYGDTASGESSTVGGGVRNRAGGPYATVSGGSGNVVTGWSGTVGGGVANSVIGNDGTVGGGSTNTAGGWGGTVPGGRQNQADGDYSHASGFRAKALHDGSYVWADQTDEDFASTADDQFLIRASGGVGIGTTTPDEDLTVDGNVHITGNLTIDGSDPSNPARMLSGTYVGNGASTRQIDIGVEPRFVMIGGDEGTEEIWGAIFSGYAIEDRGETNQNKNATAVAQPYSNGFTVGTAASGHGFNKINITYHYAAFL